MKSLHHCNKEHNQSGDSVVAQYIIIYFISSKPPKRGRSKQLHSYTCNEICSVLQKNQSSVSCDESGDISYCVILRYAVSRAPACMMQRMKFISPMHQYFAVFCFKYSINRYCLGCFCCEYVMQSPQAQSTQEIQSASITAQSSHV